MLKVIYWPFSFLILFCVQILQSVSAGNGRIIGGTEAELGQFPSIVSINIYENGNLTHWCGGTIVHPQWILTAGHCAKDFIKAPTFVQADSLNPTENGTIYNVTTIAIHPGYTFELHSVDDLALLKLDKEITLSDTAKVVEIGEAEANESCTVVGWGATKITDSPSILWYANVTALSAEDCDRLAKGGIYDKERGPGQLCAYGGFGIAPCYGDSGGPLYCNGKLAGAVSFGIQPCAQGFPDVFTRVNYYTDWIKSTISPVCEG